MSGPLLDEKILAISRHLAEHEIPHAFGGALSLAYYGTPRGTQDIDINVFVAADDADRILDLLAPLGVDRGTELERARLRREGQIRLYWDRTPLDLFFSYDPLHAACHERRRAVPFGDVDIEILSAEDLIIFKVIFDRPKDWDDVAEVLYALAGDFDASYALNWLRRILDADDARLARFEQALASTD